MRLPSKDWVPADSKANHTLASKRNFSGPASPINSKSKSFPLPNGSFAGEPTTPAPASATRATISSSAGLIFWHPKGGLIRKTMEDLMRDECIRRGYEMVYTPHIIRCELWKISGHEGFTRGTCTRRWSFDEQSTG